MTTQLIGIATDDPTSYSEGYTNLVMLFKFAASASGSLSEITIKYYGNQYAKVAVYVDNAGEPGTLLAYRNTDNALAEGWNTINLNTTVSLVE
jgi:hypothetical protein